MFEIGVHTFRLRQNGFLAFILRSWDTGSRYSQFIPRFVINVPTTLNKIHPVNYPVNYQPNIIKLIDFFKYVFIVIPDRVIYLFLHV